MPRIAPLCAALLVLSPALALAEDPAPGAYALRGWGVGAGLFTGRAHLEASEGALTLTVRRTSHTSVQRALVPDRDGWVFEELMQAHSRRGATGALEDEASAAPAEARTFRVRYRRAGKGLLGFWQVRQGRRTLDSGIERLTPLGDDARPRVHVAVSVDWEGRAMTPYNLEAMEAFRKAALGVPLTHFINAAYFTKPDADREGLVACMKRVVLAGDETGLHVHGWRSLFEASGVTFRTEPNFWGAGRSLSPVGGDMGHEVEIGAYTVAELRAVLARSRKLLLEAGYTLSGSFRAGGWMATPGVLEAIRAEGFGVDSSATDNTWHDELQGYALLRRIREVWPDATATSQPYRIETPAGGILEMPDTGALADYVTADEMVAHIRAALERLAMDPTSDVFVHVGFHQETAARYAHRVSEAIAKVRPEAGDALVFETLEASAGRWRAGR